MTGMTMTRVLLGIVVWAVAQTATAQEAERSIGIDFSPWFRVHDESTCCSAVGVWLQIGRFQIEHGFAINNWAVASYRESPDHHPEPVTRELDGHATTVLVDAKTWRMARLVTRLRFGLGYRVATRPPFHSGALHVGMTVDFPADGRSFLRTGLRGFFPEPSVGGGFRF